MRLSYAGCFLPTPTGQDSLAQQVYEGPQRVSAVSAQFLPIHVSLLQLCQAVLGPVPGQGFQTGQCITLDYGSNLMPQVYIVLQSQV